MTLVDSSVWIDALRGHVTPATRLLRDLLGYHRVLMGDLILAEVLRGLASDLAFQRVRRELLQLPMIELGGADVAVKAARNYRNLRGRGITVRSLVDAIIATRCIEDGLTLLHADRDYQPFVEHLGLRSAT